MDGPQRSSWDDSDRVRRTNKTLGLFLFVVLMAVVMFAYVKYHAIYPDATDDLALGWAALMAIAACTFLIREEHAGHVYTLWYLFWLTSCCASLIFFYLESLDVLNFDQFYMLRLPEGAPFWQRALRWYFGVSTDISGEITLLLLLVGVIAVPQALSFLVSGLFGCGTRPVLIGKIVRFALLCLVKFFCVFSGIAFARLGVLLAHQTPYAERINELVHAVVPPCLLLSSAFFVSLVYFHPPMVDDIGAGIGSIRIVRSIRSYMTRYTER
jgi:hypothetical protein